MSKQKSRDVNNINNIIDQKYCNHSVFISILLCFFLINNTNAADTEISNSPFIDIHDAYPNKIAADTACVARILSITPPLLDGFGNPSGGGFHCHREIIANGNPWPEIYGFNPNMHFFLNQPVDGFSRVPKYSVRYIYPSFYLPAEDDNPNCEGRKRGNPCDVATGIKTQAETDYSSNGSLNFIRYYRSRKIADHSGSIGHSWQHNFSSRIVVNSHPHSTKLPETGENWGFQETEKKACEQRWPYIKSERFRGLLSTSTAQYQNGLCQIEMNGGIVANLTIKQTLEIPVENRLDLNVITIVDNNGRRHQFQKQAGVWVDLKNQGFKLQPNGSNWKFTDLKDTVSIYASDGKIISLTTIQGRTTSYNYNDQGLLETITDPNGLTLTLTYNTSNLIETVITPKGTITYRYDSIKNLEYVDYFDGTTRQYHYEKSNFPHHLTGITDENGNRFATWDYDSQGRAILSEHAGHTEKVTFTYNNNKTTTVTDALGDTSIYHFIWTKQGIRISQITGDQCKTCSKGHMKIRSYDTNGFLSSFTDWNGNITHFTKDTTGLELSRTEAFGTPEEITITTDWHTDFRLPIKVTKGNKVTEYTYDTQGRLKSKTTSNVQ